jgi:thioredoxin 1
MINIHELNEMIWEREVLRSKILTAVDFWDDYCSWCLRFNSIYEDTMPNYKGKIKFTKLNMKENPGNRRIAAKYNIIGKPTLKFFLNGQVVGEVIGIKTKGRLKKILNDILEKTKRSQVN